VEPEIAHDEHATLDRISGTVRLNVQCRIGAARRGIADRLMPVIQGWKAEHYLRRLFVAIRASQSATARPRAWPRDIRRGRTAPQKPMRCSPRPWQTGIGRNDRLSTVRISRSDRRSAHQCRRRQ
jgi:hypothetical protein